MANGVTPDGINPNTRIHPTTERRARAKVVDNVSNSSTYASRLISMGKPWSGGKTFDAAITISDAGLGEWFSGLETLSGAAEDDLLELSYAQTAFAQPVVSIMLESFANAGPEQTIDLDVYKMERAAVQTISTLGNAVYGTGSGDQILGLGAHVDDATTVATIGGQSRNTYTGLKGTVTASSGTLTLAKLATLDDTIAASGLDSEMAGLNLTTKTIFSLFESLLHPSVRQDIQKSGYDVMPVRGSQIMKRGNIGTNGGFTVLAHRGQPLLRDDKATSGVWYKLNENYLEFRGRTTVPSKYRDSLEKVDLGSRSTIEGVGAEQTMPSDHGWFFQKMQMMPYQAGMVGRFFLIGQVVGTQPRRHGKLTGITGV